MKIIFTLFLLFFLALSSLTYASVRNEQSSSFDIYTITDPSVSETYYGELTGYPHTYEFAVQENIAFKALLSTASGHSKADDLSLILVKEEKRGVSEVGRVTGKDTQWVSVYDHATAVRLRESQSLDFELESGIYRLEVSSPSNLRSYKIELNGGGSMSYKELFTARQVFGLSYFSIIFAVRVYIPLLLLLTFVYYRKYKKGHVS